MYAELTLILKEPIERTAAIAALKTMIGGNAVDVRGSVEGTPLADVADLALCAEQVSVRANVVYFMAGSDTLTANIFATSIPQIRVQCVRISRQLASQGLKTKKVGASILVTENGSGDMDILIGEEIDFWYRGWEALKDRFIGKFIPALLTVFLASELMAGTPTAKSAQIGFVAAIVGALLDALLVALSADNWNWKESK